MKRFNLLLIIINVLFIVFLATEFFYFYEGVRLDWRDEIAYMQAEMEDDKNFVSKLGWTNRPGAAISREDPNVLERVWPNGMRECRPEIGKKSRYKVAFVGCSNTFGEGVSGPETMVWRLNDKYQDVTFDNWGVRGYRPVQMLARVRLLAEQRKYDLIVYNATNGNLPRTQYMSIQGSFSLAPNSKYVLAPFISDIFFCFREHYSNENIFFIENRSLTLDLLKRAYIQANIQPAEERGNHKYTPKLGYIIDEMAKSCRENHTDFLICGLDCDINETIFPYINPKIKTIVIGWMPQYETQYRVMKNPAFHPNAEVHAHWADNFSKWFDTQDYLNNVK